MPRLHGPLRQKEGDIDRFSAHLTANGVDVAKTAVTLGPVLKVLPDEERFASSSSYDMGAWANRMVRDSYRSPFVMPDMG